MTVPRFLWLFPVLIVFCFPFGAQAEEFKPDDRVIFDLSAEDWVTTKTARITANIAASVSSSTAGTTRAAMDKALNDLVKADWRLISFNRGQDQTGMELWNAMYEARLPENMLSGLNENAKKLSKPGMQLSILGIDFSPTLDEMQSAMAQLRAKIYKMANDQLAILNSTLPERNYRIALINFSPESMFDNDEMQRKILGYGRNKMMATMETAVATAPSATEPMERSEKIIMTARVVMAALPPAAVKQ